MTVREFLDNTKLNECEKYVLKMLYEDDKTFTEIAKSLNRTKNTSSIIYTKALRKLRAYHQKDAEMLFGSENLDWFNRR